MGHRSKRYRSEAEKVNKEPVSLAEAVEKIKSFKGVKFDQSVECVLNLGIDPKQADQAVRGSISLPHGIGKKKRVVAFCEEGDVGAAKEAGARVLARGAGRAGQMNAGAAATDSALLLFVHADSLVPLGFDSWVRRALSGPGRQAGGLGHLRRAGGAAAGL